MAEQPYSEKVMDHFLHPRNVGEMADPDGVGRVGNPVCGDMMEVYIKVKEDRIEEVKFKTFGCGSAIASSLMTNPMSRAARMSSAVTLEMPSQ